MKINLYNKNYIKLLCPFALENFWHIVACIKDNNTNIPTYELKPIVLEVVEYLLDNKLLFLVMENNNSSKMTTSEILNFLDVKWKYDMDFIDLYVLAWFKFEKWYVNSLKKKGLDETTNWEYFVKNKIGDLEKWIEENKPK